jgi:2-polyprenyl-6-methoxyphenol hydroxylase-like FAD-dependent oxidoreductase
MSACHIAGELKIRPVDLYVNDAGHQPGVVLVGDAFATSCPVAGYRLRQGIHRHRTALQCPHPAMAGC